MWSEGDGGRKKAQVDGSSPGWNNTSMKTYAEILQLVVFAGVRYNAEHDPAFDTQRPAEQAAVAWLELQPLHRWLMIRPRSYWQRSQVVTVGGGSGGGGPPPAGELPGIRISNVQVTFTRDPNRWILLRSFTFLAALCILVASVHLVLILNVFMNYGKTTERLPLRTMSMLDDASASLVPRRRGTFFKIEPLINRNASPPAFNRHAVLRALRGNLVAGILSHQLTSLHTSHPVESSPTPLPLKPFCPDIPPSISGKKQERRESANLTWEELEFSMRLREGSGGDWHPDECRARHRVAIIIPYRDRKSHLLQNLAVLHRLLQAQLLHYTIYVVEQEGKGVFNKGTLMNGAARFVLNRGWVDCFIFHDVDLLPVTDNVPYSCPPFPRHLSVNVDRLTIGYPYYELLGGVVAIRTEHFLLINGYSNLYWGWGGEDDDFGWRVIASKLPILRAPEPTGRYRMLFHHRRKRTNRYIIHRLIRTSKHRFYFDGYNTDPSQLLWSKSMSLFTHLMVKVNEPPQSFMDLERLPGGQRKS
ncbi:unnamed protein product [Darwinula stevensoni]|uniref:Uncharacterized protein n=1 Tax=Darwinula stevensoni TaxID=69355 RepID=A0A7R9FPR3_9CRUS|nr:unnamed protein product [Darwinula stevensoni]CAG0897958.1 unnamed protein product [Darwinula stevensoni]